MSYQYVLQEIAQYDYEEALKWYMERSEQAAENFITAVDNALQVICDHPDRWRNEYKHYYELGVKKYPYSIIYFIESEKQRVVISSVYHHKRNPKKKYKRAK